MSCDLFLDDHTAGVDCDNKKHQDAIAARARARVGWWSKIERRGDPAASGGDWRDYLDGQPIHCGAGLELQGVDRVDDDYGSFSRPRGESYAVPVRYETIWAGRAKGIEPVMFHTDVCGHEFLTPLDEWMRFRWPPGRR